MNKKVLAVAVAGALALPGVALAQSSVTISGIIKESFGTIKIANPAPARVGHTSSTRLNDESSRIIFNVREDLGGGLSAIAQIDWRVQTDAGTDAVNGNNHLGLQNLNSWGRVRFGRQDLHYFNTESLILVRGPLVAAPWSVTSSVASGAAIAVTSRTVNTLQYTTPNWGGFTVDAAYSTNPLAASEADIGSLVRKGRAWNIQPNYAGSNFQIGYSYWSAKPDGSLADQRSDRLYGSYKWGGFMVGLVWDKSKLKNAAGADTHNRTAWSIPASYSTGPHSFHAHFTKARSDKVAGSNTGARMFAASYGYDLSKRTSVAVTYASIRNDSAAAYNLFGSASPAIGTPDAGIAAGEDPRTWVMTLRHAF